MYIGIDIGGTNARVAASYALKDGFRFTKKVFKFSHNFDYDFSHIIQVIKEFEVRKVYAIGMGVPGDLNKEKTSFVSPSKNLAEWSNKPIEKTLTETFHCPVFLENDAVVAAIGESHFGKGKDKDFTYLIWGTGIGGAVVHWEKEKAMADKLNWYQYFDSWEQDCGGNAIRKHFGKSAQLLNEEEWKEIMKDFTQHLLTFCENTKPSLVIFGGGIAFKQTDRLYSSIHTQVLEHKLPEIQISTIDEDTGLYGAFGLLKQEVR